MTQGTLKIHSENLLPIIKKWLYSDRDIFLRELVSNACDAISKLKILKDAEGISIDESSFRINLTLDTEKKLLTISDTGLGMTKEEVEEYICQLAFSGAEAFLQKYDTKGAQDPFIGHFGLGFYSAFMVSSFVEIETKSYLEGSAPAHWTSDGSSTYHLDQGTRTSRGTDIILHINDDEFLDESKLRSILTRYCSFLPYPVFLGDEQINKDEPLWVKNPKDCTDEEYLDFYRKLYPMESDPIFWVHLNVDHPFHLQGILYFPKITPRFDFNAVHMKLYSNRVFVSDNIRDLFPNFLTILRGAIDSSDIPLNVSRSYLQMDSTVRKLSSHISKKVTDRLALLHKEDQKKFESIWPDIETIVKLGMLHDEKFCERAKPFLIWKNTQDGWVTIEEYTAAHSKDYDAKIFYTASDIDHSAFLSLYQEKGIEVIIGGGPLDTAIFNHLESAHEGKIKFQRIDGGIDDIIINDDKEQNLLHAGIGAAIKEDLSEHGVEVEAKHLASESLPGFVMIAEETRRFREYLAMTQKEMPKEILGKHTFVVNTNNKLIAQLSTIRKHDPELAKLLTTQIYHTSLLAQKELHPELLSGFIAKTNAALEKLALRYNADN